MKDKVYVISLSQVSNQDSSNESWFENPEYQAGETVVCKEPAIKEFISPVEARRMSKILKRALFASLSTLKKSGIENPDAIITGTGMGCIENSEKFLVDIINYGEEMLKPTLFMQSTHNTISSVIANRLHCHGYNNTYSHKGISFESALMDAWLQLRTGKAESVLLGCHDEITPLIGNVMKYSHPAFNRPGECSMACVLTNKYLAGKSICQVDSVNIFYKPSVDQLIRRIEESGCKILLTGLNGNPDNDRAYHEVLDRLGPSYKVLRYKHVFGDSFSVPAIGFYCGVKIIEKGEIPEWMNLEGDKEEFETPEDILLLNYDYQSSWGMTKISKLRR